MILFIFSRILDVISTYLNTKKYGWGVEGNILMQKVGEKGFFLPYQILMVILVILLLRHVPEKIRNSVYCILSVFSILVAISNFYCFIFIR